MLVEGNQTPVVERADSVRETLTSVFLVLVYIMTGIQLKAQEIQRNREMTDNQQSKQVIEANPKMTHVL